MSDFLSFRYESRFDTRSVFDLLEPSQFGTEKMPVAVVELDCFRGK